LPFQAFSKLVEGLIPAGLTHLDLEFNPSMPWAMTYKTILVRDDKNATGYYYGKAKT
jgi:hypothetical protein